MSNYNEDSNMNENKRLTIFKTARSKLNGLEESKKQIILDTAKQLEDIGMPKELISSEMARELEGFTTARYIQECLGREHKRKKEDKRTSSLNHHKKEPEQLITLTNDGSNGTEPEPEILQPKILSPNKIFAQDTAQTEPTNNTNNADIEIELDLTDFTLWRKLFIIKQVGTPKVYFRCRDNKITEVIGPKDKRNT